MPHRAHPILAQVREQLLPVPRLSLELRRPPADLGGPRAPGPADLREGRQRPPRRVRAGLPRGSARGSEAREAAGRAGHDRRGRDGLEAFGGGRSRPAGRAAGLAGGRGAADARPAPPHLQMVPDLQGSLPRDRTAA